MELVVVVGALVALDVAAYLFGSDSRRNRTSPSELEREAWRVPAIRF
jgi:hypothetical protein